MYSESIIKKAKVVNRNTMEEIKEIYFANKDRIKERLAEFKQVWDEGSEEHIFAELIFCILTPQSKARYCWNAVVKLLNGNLLLSGDKNRIIKELNGVRFKYKKAEYIVETRKMFVIDGKVSIRSKIKEFDDNKDVRVWLAKNVGGLGFKEASHFLRNIGLGENIAILDRHILKNLNLLGLIEEVPHSLSRKMYFEIENKMMEFADMVKIPVSHLDLVMWYKGTGEIFK